MFLPHRQWSPGQQLLIDTMEQMVTISDANDHHVASPLSRMIHVDGEPGNGKTEAIIYGSNAISQKHGKVLIGCPTGILVSSYRDRLPSDASITVETAHCVENWPRR